MNGNWKAEPSDENKPFYKCVTTNPKTSYPHDLIWKIKWVCSDHFPFWGKYPLIRVDLFLC